MFRFALALPLLLATCWPVRAADLATTVDQQARAIEPKVIGWRRYIHEHPELSNREVETGKYIAAHLRSLGMEVQTGIGKTGVVGILKGGQPGKVVALRSDMDALPVVEESDLPFKSTVKTEYIGQQVGVMHACGHDAHMAILMGVAEVLAGVKDQIPGTVKFIFQPAEEGPPPGEEGGAPLVIKDGALENPKPDAIFGLHVISGIPAGMITYRSGPLMASADWLYITVKGKQTHGAWPWAGIDPVVTSAQIITGLQNIVARQVDISKEPALSLSRPSTAARARTSSPTRSRCPGRSAISTRTSASRCMRASSTSRNRSQKPTMPPPK